MPSWSFKRKKQLAGQADADRARSHRIENQDREIALKDREIKYDWMREWGVQTKKYMKGAWNKLGEAWSFLESDKYGLNDTIQQLTKEWGDFRENYATPDYEGVSGRAMADVAGRSEIGRKAEASRLLSLGIDPGSGRYSVTERGGRNTEALNSAMAANTARVAEKTRGEGAAKTSFGMGAALGGLQQSDLDARMNISQGYVDLAKTVAASPSMGYAAINPKGDFSSRGF